MKLLIHFQVSVVNYFDIDWCFSICETMTNYGCCNLKILTWNGWFLYEIMKNINHMIFVQISDVIKNTVKCHIHWVLCKMEFYLWQIDLSLIQKTTHGGLVMPFHLMEFLSTLEQLMAWYLKATIHHLNQCLFFLADWPHFNEISSEIKKFHSRKYIGKWCLQSVGNFFYEIPMC